MKVYYDHAFPGTWFSGKVSRKVIDLFASNLPDWMDDTLIMDPGFGKVDHVLNYYPDFDAKHKIAICMNDTYSLCKDKADAYLGEGQYNVISLANYQQFWYCGYCSYLHWIEHKDQSFPCDMTYLFLNYNRKPKPNRVILVERLRDYRLNAHGIITLGAWDGEGEVLTIPENDNVEDLYDHRHHGIPNDVMSLGDLDIWNKSFINVVSETSYSELYISEKTAKPLVGKRPFMIYGAEESLRLLKQWGFKTFSDYWDESYDDVRVPEKSDIIASELNRLSKLSKAELNEMYLDMQDILEYNHAHFFGDFHKANMRGLNNMADAYVDHVFGDKREL